MIDKNTVQKVVEEWLAGNDYFLVDLSVSADDKIVVVIDHAEGVWIEDCADLSRHIEAHLNRDEEDYELEVGSAASMRFILGSLWRPRRMTVISTVVFCSR